MTMQERKTALSPKQMSPYFLSTPLTPLIGREREVSEVCTLLHQSNIRLLTLIGPGGVGKTRLAIAVAEALLDDFGDGVYFVPLAAITDPARVIPTIAETLGLQEISGLSLQEQVYAALRDQHLLLILDNFEQITTAAPQLVPLLTLCPRLSILVTSRAALQLIGEQEFAVLPLSVPDLTQLPAPEILSLLAVVRLFVLRAQAVQPNFALTTANARTIAEICARLDGLPLAIELAAARIKLLPPLALLRRLSRRLVVLTGGARDLPIRQQTLRNTIQWSYDLLSQSEQRLFRWLAIFVGGCTLEAAEAVCQPVGDYTLYVLDGIESLLNKSLVQQTVQEGEEPRIVMLETIREFALECLQQHGELEAARRAHAHYYLTLAERAEPYLISSEELAWCNRLDHEMDNLRAILQAAIAGDEDEAELALRLASALRYFWEGRGYHREGRGFLEQLLARPRAVSTPIHLKALFIVGEIMWLQQDIHDLEPISDQVQALAREHGDQVDIANSLNLHGAALMLCRHDYIKARACLEESLTWARTSGNRLVLVAALLNLGNMALLQRDYSRAIALFEESLAFCRAIGSNIILNAALVVLANALILQGNTAYAQSLMEESLSIFRAFGNPHGGAIAFNLLGQIAFQQGELDRAETLLADSAMLFHKVGDQHSLASVRLRQANVALQRKDYTVARARYEQTLTTALDVGYTKFIASGLRGLGMATAAQGFTTEAVRLLGAAEAVRGLSSTSSSMIYEAMVEQVRSRSDTVAFAQAMAEGRAMTPTQALALYHDLPPQPSETSQQAHSARDVSLPPTSRSASYPARLTAREVEVLQHVAQGLTDAQIAERLAISPRTVTTHITSIYNKLGIKSRVAATHFATENHLLP